MKPGKNKEGYWNTELQIEQTEHALDAFESMAPGCVGVFFFDHSSGHAALPADALNVNLLNLGDSNNSKTVPPLSRNGWFMVDEKKIVQDMNIVFDNKKQRKGKKTILPERGLWVRGLTDEWHMCERKVTRFHRRTRPNSVKLLCHAHTQVSA